MIMNTRKEYITPRIITKIVYHKILDVSPTNIMSLDNENVDDARQSKQSSFYGFGFDDE